MTPERKPPPSRGFTLLELLFTVTIIAILASLLLPALQSAKGKANRVRCASNLRQIGTAFHAWSHDHGDKLPMELSTNSGGTLEFAQTGESMLAFRHFQAISNELVEPRLLVCPADRRPSAPNFGELQNSNISYAVNTRAIFGKTDSVLASDRNIRTSGRMEFTYLQFGPGDAVEWSSSLHGSRGNVLFGDAHVEPIASRDAARAFTASGDVVLVVPQPEPGAGVAGGGDGSGPPPVAGNNNADGNPGAGQSASGSGQLAAAGDGNAVAGNSGNGGNSGGNGGSGAAGSSANKPPAPPSPGSPSNKPPAIPTINLDHAPRTPATVPPAPGDFAPVDQPPAATTSAVPNRVTTTNAPGAAVPAHPRDDEAEDWRIAYAQWLGKVGSRFNYILLLLLLAAFLAIEIQRRRRKKKRQ